RTAAGTAHTTPQRRRAPQAPPWVEGSWTSPKTWPCCCSSPRPKARSKTEERGDVHEPMLGGSLDEDQGAGADGLLLPAGPERRLAADGQVPFVLGVGPLLVGLPGLEAVEAHAQGRHPQELPPALAGSFTLHRQVVQVEGLHRGPNLFAGCSVPSLNGKARSRRNLPRASSRFKQSEGVSGGGPRSSSPSTAPRCSLRPGASRGA